MRIFIYYANKLQNFFKMMFIKKRGRNIKLNPQKNKK